MFTSHGALSFLQRSSRDLFKTYRERTPCGCATAEAAIFTSSSGSNDILNHQPRFMKQFSLFSLALKNLKRKSFRTGVLIFAIAMFVFLLVFAVSFTISITSSLEQSSQRLGADLIVVPVGARTVAQEYLLESKKGSFYMPIDIIDKVKKIEGVTATTHQTYISSISGSCCDIIPTGIVAFDPETDFIVKPWLNKAIGRDLKKGEAIAGAGTSENLGLGLLQVETTIFNNRFKIIGTLEPTGTGLDNSLFMTKESLEEIVESGVSPLRQGDISVIFVKLADGLDPDYMGRVVEGNIVEVDVVTRSSMGVRFLTILADINKIFLVTISLSSLLTIFLVWSIFSAIANERSKEIGIMRAIGAKESHIVNLFLLEVLTLGVIGSAIGAVAGTYLTSLLADSFALIKSISAGLRPPEQIVIAIIGLFLGSGICVAGAMLPINRIKKMEPLLAIKEE
jgi:putative ABC transport system permease protein